MSALAFLNGDDIPEAELRLPYYDLGVVGGVAVSEMLRTFAHQPFRIEAHLERLALSLELTALTPAMSLAELRAALERIVAHNTQLIDPADDLGVIVFVTAGWNPTYVGADAAGQHGCTVGIHTFPLQYRQFGPLYTTGVSLRTSTVPALPSACVDRRIKSRSRLHWHLAQQAVRRVEPGAIAILQDEQGCLTETAATNVCALVDDVIVSPPAGEVLEGVSLQMVAELAGQIGRTFQRAPLREADVLRATEVWLTSTPSCLLPVVRFNGQTIGDGQPGPVFQQLLEAWSRAVGCDFRRQASRL